MQKRLCLLLILFVAVAAQSQQLLSPELLWKLGRVSGKGVTTDGKYVVYGVSTPSVAENKSSSKTYFVPIGGGNATLVNNADSLLPNDKLSPDGKYRIGSEEVKVKKISGADFYPELSKSNVLIYDQLNYRHWDEWEDGKYGHVMVTSTDTKIAKDIMANEPYDCPLKQLVR